MPKAVIETRIASLTRRILAFLIDFLFAYILSNLFFNLKFFNESYYWLAARFRNSFTGNFLGPENLSFLLLTFLIYFLLRFYLSLLFSRSLGQFILGLKIEGGFWWRRIGNAAKSTLGCLFFPFLIFDLPLVFGKRSFEEYLTQTSLIQISSKKMAYTFSVITIVILSFFAMFSPLFRNLTIIDGLKVDMTFSKPKEAIIHNKKINLQSNRFRFSVKTSASSRNSIFIPTFEIVKIRGKKKISPYLLTYNNKTKNDGHLKVRQHFYLFKLIEKVRSKNYFFSHSFKNLNDVLKKENEKVKRKSFDTAAVNTPLLSPEVKEEIILLVQASINLNVRTVLSHIKKYGPFLSGFIELKNTLLKKRHGGGELLISFEELGGVLFIKLKETFKNLGPERKEILETLIPLNSNNALVLELGKDLTGDDFFKDNILRNAHWFLDYKDTFLFPVATINFTPFTILDFYISTILEQKQIEQLEEYIFQLFFSMSIKALESNDQKIKRLILNSLMKFREVGRLMNRRKKIYDKKFFNLLIQLQSSLERNDRDYFGL